MCLGSCLCSSSSLALAMADCLALAGEVLVHLIHKGGDRELVWDGGGHHHVGGQRTGNAQ